MSHYFTNENLKSNIKKVLVKVSNNTFTFNTDNGVFSKKGMDFGTRTLIEVLLKENLYGDILDVGCGYGVIGIILSSFFNNKINSVSMFVYSDSRGRLSLQDEREATGLPCG